MEFVAFCVIIILSLIAFIHFYWAFGGSVGIDKALPTAPDGTRIINPGKALTAIVGFVMLGFAFVVYKLGLSHLTNEFYSYLGWMIAGIFLLRSIGEFRSVGFFKKIANTVFARYDTLFYSPLCLYLAFCYAILASK